MKSLKDIVAAQHAARAAHDDPLNDRLFAEIVRLAEEVCVLNDRLDTAARLAQAGKQATAAAIAAYQPDDAEISERLERNREFLEALFARLSGASGSR